MPKLSNALGSHVSSGAAMFRWISANQSAHCNKVIHTTPRLASCNTPLLLDPQLRCDYWGKKYDKEPKASQKKQEEGKKKTTDQGLFILANVACIYSLNQQHLLQCKHGEEEGWGQGAVPPPVLKEAYYSIKPEDKCLVHVRVLSNRGRHWLL